MSALYLALATAFVLAAFNWTYWRGYRAGALWALGEVRGKVEALEAAVKTERELYAKARRKN